MNTQKEESAPVVVPKRILKGVDGREPFAEKLARVNAVLKKAGIPDLPSKKEA